MEGWTSVIRVGWMSLRFRCGRQAQGWSQGRGRWWPFASRGSRHGHFNVVAILQELFNLAAVRQGEAGVREDEVVGMLDN